jgi:hypothetical protein
VPRGPNGEGSETPPLFNPGAGLLDLAHEPPQKLYKYCPFNVFSLRAINEAEIFHASRRQFNDPLDCNPTLDLDIGTKDAIRLLARMLELRG